MEIKSVLDDSFKAYGNVMEGYDFSALIEAAEKLPCPKADTVYVASEPKLEEVPVFDELQNRGFGGIPVQVGYCNGYNKKLNALEYHRSSELNIAATDMILILGKQQDLENGDSYDTSKAEIFLLPKGVGVELYATSLHYAPCSVKEEGFRSIVVLPKGTNTDIDFEVPKTGEDRLLTAKNKWLIAHKDSGIENAVYGLKGVNITIA